MNKTAVRIYITSADYNSYNFYRIIFKLLSPTKGSGYIVGAHSMHHQSGLLVLSDRCYVLEKNVTKLHKR